MRVTIIANDAAVYVDGLALWPIDLSGLSSDIHAVQWYDTHGEVEFRSDPMTWQRPPNLEITDLSPYQVFVDRHATALAAVQAAALSTTVAASTGAVRVIAT